MTGCAGPGAGRSLAGRPVAAEAGDLVVTGGGLTLG